MSQRGMRTVRAFCQEAFEDRLGVAFIQPGDPVIVEMSGCGRGRFDIRQEYLYDRSKQGGTAIIMCIVPRSGKLRGIFVLKGERA